MKTVPLLPQCHHGLSIAVTSSEHLKIDPSSLVSGAEQALPSVLTFPHRNCEAMRGMRNLEIWTTHKFAGSSTLSSFAFLDFRTFDASVVLSSVQTFTGHEVMNFGIPAIFNQGAVCILFFLKLLCSFFFFLFFLCFFHFPSFRVSCFKVSDLCFLVQELLDIKSLSTVPRIWTQCLSIPS